MMESSLAHIHIALCCDENYAPYSTVVMLSAIESTRLPESLCFHLVASGIGDATKTRMQREINELGASLFIYEPNKSDIFRDLPAGRFGEAVYQRILLAECLPNRIGRVIYLDGDILVKKDLGLLWATNIRGHMLAAVEDMSRSACKTLGMSRPAYFNSGVLLMDLDLWRTEQVHWRVAEYAAENAHRLRYVDQCSLNAVLQGRWFRLPPEWNVQAGIYKTLQRYAEGSGYSRQALEKAAASPSVIHYTGKRKPWLQYCFHPHKSEFREVLDGLSWVEPHPSRSTWRDKLVYILSLRMHAKGFLYRRQIERLRAAYLRQGA